jgi:electron transfer flavoprotein alpha subunit
VSGGPLPGGAGPELPTAGALAVLVARAGELPPGAEETVSEARGHALVLGDGAKAAASALASARHAWWCDTGPGLRPGYLSALLAAPLAAVPLILLPASPDGRDLAPRLAARLGRPLLGHAASARLLPGGRTVAAELSRIDDRLLVPAEVDVPAVATLAVGQGQVVPAGSPGTLAELTGLLAPGATDGDAQIGDAQILDAQILDAEILEILDADPATMDLAEAPLVMAGGAGLAAGLPDAAARSVFGLLSAVAAALGASAGATRVATDAGWITHDRQIGTTGVAVRPELYVALGISGAAQHAGGLGHPAHVVSVNTDPSSPMTALADLGIVADARGLLFELARRLDVPVPAAAREVSHEPAQ